MLLTIMFLQNLTLLHLTLNNSFSSSPLLSKKFGVLKISRCHLNRQLNGLLHSEHSFKVLISKSSFQHFLSPLVTISKTDIFERKLFKESVLYSGSEIEFRYCLFHSFVSDYLLFTNSIGIYNSHFYNITCNGRFFISSSLNINQSSFNQVSCVIFSHMMDFQNDQSCNNSYFLKCKCKSIFLNLKNSLYCNFTKNQLFACYSRDIVNEIYDLKYLKFEDNIISNGIFDIYSSLQMSKEIELQNSIFFNNIGFSYSSKSDLSIHFINSCFVQTNISKNTNICFTGCSFDFPSNNNYKYINCRFSIDKCIELPDSIYKEEKSFEYGIIKDKNEHFIQQNYE